MHTLNSIEEIIKDIREGRMVIMTDDEARENEGDLIFAAQKTTPELVNFMMKYGRGLICVPMAPERIEGVELWDMNRDPEDSMKTAFTVSVDARVGITTGISAYDRNRTIELLADPRTRRDDLVIPGHVFPLRARKGGVLRRAGHTEAAVDLAVLAGCEPVGVICEIINDDGKMARLADLIPFAKEHGLKIGTIQNLIEYRRRSDKLVMKVSEAKLPTKFGNGPFMSIVPDRRDGTCRARKRKTGTNPALVRVHSECFTGISSARSAAIVRTSCTLP